MTAIIDLRSDTVTRPTPAMRSAMADAEVGDDVFGDDPTVNRLEERVAGIARQGGGAVRAVGDHVEPDRVKVHTQPGDELLCDSIATSTTTKRGGPAILSGVTVPNARRRLRHPHSSRSARTRFATPTIPTSSRPAWSRLENTHNRGGGKIYPIEKIEEISQWARKNGLHDAPRRGPALERHRRHRHRRAGMGQHFDTVSVCFSKGLGAPVGSALAGRKDSSPGPVAFASCSAAACGKPASSPPRPCMRWIITSHGWPRIIATPRSSPRPSPTRRGLTLEPAEVDTNLIWFGVDPALAAAKEIAARLKENGILVHAAGPQKLCVYHLDVSKAGRARRGDAAKVAGRPVRV